VTAEITGNISCIIPTGASGNGYRMRVKSSDPALTSDNNGADITIDCEQPSDVVTEVVTPTTATLNWDDVYCALEYEVQYKSAIDIDYTYVTTAASTYTLTDLAPNTPYEWAVRTICLASPDVSTGFTTSEDFTTGQNAVIDLDGISGIFLFPNPAQNSSLLQLTNAIATDLRIELFDVTGQSVQVIQQGILSAGAHQFQIDLSKVAAGIYNVRMTSNGKFATMQLIKE
jgi:hypothetical protein